MTLRKFAQWWSQDATTAREAPGSWPGALETALPNLRRAEDFRPPEREPESHSRHAPCQPASGQAGKKRHQCRFLKSRRTNSIIARCDNYRTAPSAAHDELQTAAISRWKRRKRSPRLSPGARRTGLRLSLRARSPHRSRGDRGASGVATLGHLIGRCRATRGNRTSRAAANR